MEIYSDQGCTGHRTYQAYSRWADPLVSRSDPNVKLVVCRLCIFMFYSKCGGVKGLYLHYLYVWALTRKVSTVSAHWLGGPVWGQTPSRMSGPNFCLSPALGVSPPESIGRIYSVPVAARAGDNCTGTTVWNCVLRARHHWAQFMMVTMVRSPYMTFCFYRPIIYHDGHHGQVSLHDLLFL